MNKIIKTNRGITLIALVITIIILLILAGISIAMLTGENGILTKADTATRKTEIAEAKEQAKFDIAEWIADKLEAGEEASLDDTVIQKILEGNYYEYIAEKNTYIQSMPYIYRGGRYSTKGAVSASYRNGDDGLADIGDTFRFMLYV